MKTSLDEPDKRQIRTRRAFGFGFLVGAIVVLPATLFAFVSQLGETLVTYLVPGALLLRPFEDQMQSWPAALNFGLTAAMNGLLYGAVFGAIAALVNVARR